MKGICAASVLVLVVASSCAATSANPCESESVLRAKIETFLADYNAGDLGLADRFFAAGSHSSGIRKRHFG